MSFMHESQQGTSKRNVACILQSLKRSIMFCAAPSVLAHKKYPWSQLCFPALSFPYGMTCHHQQSQQGEKNLIDLDMEHHN